MGVEELNPKIRGALRLVAYIYHVDERSSRNLKRLVRRCVLKYMAKVLGSREFEQYKGIIIRITKERWKPTSTDDRIVYVYRVSPSLYNALEKALKTLNEDLELFFEIYS